MYRVAVAVVAVVGVLAVGCTTTPPPPTGMPFTASQYPNILSGLDEFSEVGFALVSDDGKVLDPSSAGIRPSSEQVTWLDDHHLLYADMNSSSRAFVIVNTLTGAKRTTTIKLGLFPTVSSNGRVVATKGSQDDTAGVTGCVFAADFASESCTYTPLFESFIGLGPSMWLNAAGTMVTLSVFTAAGYQYQRYPIDAATGAVTDSPAPPISASGNGRAWDIDDRNVVQENSDDTGDSLLVQDESGTTTTVHSWITGAPHVPFSARWGVLAERDADTVPSVYYVSFPSGDCLSVGFECPTTLRRWDPTTAGTTAVATVPFAAKWYTRFGS